MMLQILKLGVEKLFATIHSVLKVNFGDENSVNISFHMLISLFKKERTQTAEIVATLYSEWKDLKANNTIVNENSLIKGFYQFHQEKKKFSKEQIKEGYDFIMKHKLYPK